MSIKEWLNYLNNNNVYKLTLIANCISMAMFFLRDIESDKKNKLIEKLAEIQIEIGNLFEQTLREETHVN